ncbi:MAG TPA: Hsp70 family protein [Candidatus Deferrimicrobium sp.]|nr:Hsp70 family protein [Candidatus Deferrimicrobium sp.]
MVNFFRAYLSLEGKATRLEKNLEKSILKNNQKKASSIFCKEFLLLMQKRSATLLSNLILSYISKIKDSELLKKDISLTKLQHAIYFLEIKKLYSASLKLCDYFGFDMDAIEILAKLGQANELFMRFTKDITIDKELLQAAILCWEKHNGDIRKNSIVVNIIMNLAKFSEEYIPNNPRVKEIIGQFKEAAEIYKQNNDLKNAARCYEKAEMYQEACNIYEDLRDNEGISRASELLGDYEKALKFVVKPEHKFNLLIKMERFADARKFAGGLEFPDKYFELIKEEAKKLTDIKIKSHDFIKAIELAYIAEYELSKIEDILSIGRQYYDRKISDATSDEDIKLIYMERVKFEEKAGNFGEAGRIAEEILNDLKYATLLYEKANLINRAIDTFSKIDTQEDQEKVNIRLAQLHERGGNLLKAAKLYESIGEYDKAYSLYETIQNYNKAIECYLKIKNPNPDTLIRLYTSAGEFEKVIEIYMKSETFQDIEIALSIAKKYNLTSHIKILQNKITEWLSGSEEDLKRCFFEAKDEVFGLYSTIFGIDFGTTNSVAAIFNKKSRDVEIIPTSHGYEFMPSYFGMDENNFPIFGEEARLRSLTSPHCVVARVKRSLGERKRYKLKKENYRCEEIVAKILQMLRLNVEAYLKSKVETKLKDLLKSNNLRFPEDMLNEFLDNQKGYNKMRDVVLTVPAYFNDNQKRATRDSAEIAGLNVRRLLHEPTSAALAYCYQYPYEGRLAVVDLGGGTLDISILEFKEGVYDIQIIGGDTKLGGSDIDDKLVQHVIEDIKSSLEVDINEKTHEIEIARLRDACENLKINLSSVNEASMKLTNFLNRPQYIFTLNSTELERISRSILDRIEATIQKTINEIDSKVDHFILVGNATKMPAVNGLVKRCIQAKYLKGINPGTVVATGAALEGAILSNDLSQALLLDIVPHSLGIVAINPKADKKEFSVLIKKGSKIPIRKRDTYTTYIDNQNSVHVEIYQGESNEPYKNYFVGDFILFGILPAPAHVPQIEVFFDIDTDCILIVTAKDKGTGSQQSIKIEGAVALSPKEKQNLSSYYQQRENLYQSETDLKRINNEINDLKVSCDKTIKDAEQSIKEFFELFDDKINVNTHLYKSSIEQAREIQKIFIQKDQFIYGILKYKDQFTSIINNVKKTEIKHLDFSDKDIIPKLQERINILSNYKKKLGTLLKSIEKDVLNLIEKWIEILKSIQPDTEKMDPITSANYYLTMGKVNEAREVLESLALRKEGLTEETFNLLLKCYVRIGLRDEYIDAHKRYGYLFKLIYPDFNQLNTYLNAVSESVFMIQGISQQHGPFSGSGFCIAQNLIVTNRHVVEGVTPAGIKIIGKNRSYTVDKLELDPTNDLAIILVSDKLKPFRLGEFNFIEPGEQVFAIGFGSPSSNVFSENIFISNGIINSIRTTEYSSERVIFIDTKIGSGMSGSPLINNLGEVIGIITLIRYHLGQNKKGIFAMEHQPIALPIHLIKKYLMKYRSKSE